MTTTPSILFETHGPIAKITLNRPEVFNALDKTSKTDIIQALRKAQKEPNVKVIILAAAGGKAFCSGQDLNDASVSPLQGSPVDIGKVIEEEWNPLIEAIRQCEKPVLVAIEGVVAGAGLSLVLACDWRVAKKGGKFIAGFTQIGLAPDAGLSYQLVRHMGYVKALDFALSGSALLAEDLAGYNLLNEVAEDPLARAMEVAQKWADLAPLSVKMVKKTFQLAQEISFGEVLERERSTQRMLGFSKDYAEGVKAFKEKRKPNFCGQ
jgi:2-(1,2-epoxy-1,2-dihydrophenyl)acetyl-CoA isomerase